jgi:tetratricopeptide (TPR) repeat protein
LGGREAENLCQQGKKPHERIKERTMKNCFQKPFPGALSRFGLLLGVSVLLSGAPLHADPPAYDEAKRFGYKFVLDEAPRSHQPRAPQDKDYQPHFQQVSEKQLGQNRELLAPRLYQKPEPASLIPTLLKLFQQQPQSPKIARKLALTCLNAGQPREALHWFIKAFQLDRNDHSALWNMATLAYRLGDQEKASAYFGEYARIDPYSAWGKMARQFQKGKYGNTELSEGFANVLGKTWICEPGMGSGSSSLGESGIMVIEGQIPPVDMFSTPMYGGSNSGAPVAEKTSAAKKTEKLLKNTSSKPSINKAEIEAPKVLAPAPAAVSPRVSESNQPPSPGIPVVPPTVATPTTSVPAGS